MSLQKVASILFQTKPFSSQLLGKRTPENAHLVWRRPFIRSFYTRCILHKESMVIGGGGGLIRGQMTKKKLKEEAAIDAAREIETGVSLTTKKVVALVGRPNVGKSTLFNVLIESGQKKAIVTQIPGTTRDRSYGSSMWLGREFVVVDTGGLVGIDLKRATDSDMDKHIRQQTLVAMQEADKIIFVIDCREGLTEHDKQIAKFLRTRLHDKQIILAVNKADNVIMKDEENLKVYERLGLGTPMPLSALHSDGVGDILDRIIEDIDPTENSNEDDEKKNDDLPMTEADIKEARRNRAPSSIRIAIVGQPNVGKSSLLNKLLKEERSIVSEEAGTTHDPVDQEFTYQGRNITLVDTAGIRRGGHRKEGVEPLIILRALRTIERAHVVVLLIDPVRGIGTQDLKVASHILEHNKSVIVAINKWDLLRDKPTAKNEYMKHIREQLKFMDYVPVEFTSAKTGYHLDSLMDLAMKVFDERSFHFPAHKLNDTIRAAVANHAPSMSRGRTLRIKFVTQADAYPPTFVFFVNDPDLIEGHYKRYLENAIRDRHPFLGTPIKLIFKKSEGKRKQERPKDPQQKALSKAGKLPTVVFDEKKQPQQPPRIKEITARSAIQEDIELLQKKLDEMTQTRRRSKLPQRQVIEEEAEEWNDEEDDDDAIIIPYQERNNRESEEKHETVKAKKGKPTVGEVAAEKITKKVKKSKETEDSEATSQPARKSRKVSKIDSDSDQKPARSRKKAVKSAEDTVESEK